MTPDTFKIDLGQTFPHLSRPPIVEAVIHWQARAQCPLNTEQSQLKLKELLPEYPSIEPIQFFEWAATMKVPDSAPVIEHQHGWLGYRLALQRNTR